MKNLLFMISLIGASYYVYTHHSPFQTEATDPYFVEIRVSVDNTNVTLVGFGKMLSYEDCLARSAIVWRNVFKRTGKLNLINTQCSKTLSKKYQKLFDNKPITASYIAFDKDNGRERDGRFVFYGIPSSYIIKECNKIIAQARNNYHGKIFCVKGSIG